MNHDGHMSAEWNQSHLINMTELVEDPTVQIQRRINNV